MDEGHYASLNVPPDTHGYILPSLCKCLPVYDEICRCSANFLRACILHNSILVKLLVCMVLFMDGVSRPLAATLYSVCVSTVSHSRNCCQGGG